jgi:UDP-glucose 6-dehydrogenase
MDYKIGIAGFGFVGQALYGSIRQGVKLVVYDKYKLTDYVFNDLLECDIIFACLPTLSKSDGQDAGPYQDFFKDLINAKYKGIIVIKSTILYSNVQPYEDQLKIVHNPEFLNQNTSVSDFKNQEIIILGGRIDYTKIVQSIYQSYFSLNVDINYEFCSLEEAINFKYVHNVYHAYKVLFWNMIHEELGNSRKYSDLYHKVVKRNELSRVCADGKKGYGGDCFLKDVKAFDCDSPNTLTDYMIKYNTELRGENL